MKIITEGGISSKNSPIYTIDSFKLANKNNKVDGIKIDIYLTKDNKIILLNEEVMKKTGIDVQFICEHTFSYLENLNIGTKVKRNKIISIDELLKTYKHKYIVVNIKENQYRNDILVKTLFKYVNNNTNIEWFLMSNSSKIVNLLYSQETNAKIGKIVNNYKDTTYSFDFYSTNIENINLFPDKKDSIIVINDVNTQNDLIQLFKYKNNFNNLFAITNNYGLITNKYIK